MNASLSSLLESESHKSVLSLAESNDFIKRVMQKVDEDVDKQHVEILHDVDTECDGIKARQAKFEKLLKFTNGMMTAEMRADYAQLEQDVKGVGKRYKQVDKEVALYRESITEQYYEAHLQPVVKKIKDTLTNYLGMATPLAITQYNLMLKREAGWRSRIKVIDSSPLPEEPKKETVKRSIGCVFILSFLLILLPCFFIVAIIIIFTAEIIFDKDPSNLLWLAIVCSCILSWLLTQELYIRAAARKAAHIHEENKRKWEIKVKNLKEDRCKLREETLQKLKSVQPLLELYRKRDTSAVETFITVALKKLPQIHHNNPVISVSFSNSSVIVDYLLPDIDDIRDLPIDVTIKRGSVSLSGFKESQLSKVYNKLVYDIVLAVMNCVFNHDEVAPLEAVTVNGILDTVDKSVGKPIRICACSLQMNREEFKELNLELIDSYECFRRFKGIAAANIADKVAINPIQKIQDKDTRFVEGYSVASELQRGTNLATMPWQDFENLIRELFEKLFSKHGGSCKVTRASRDGGVDAVAFNPDPISGGKFIIQAKRYTNLVSPSAVRDLYGTLQHEGANKAILVTTSDYGGDSYTFAKDKPIQLLNGSHLLHYLKEELGMTDVYINLDEAKKLNKEN